MSSWLYEAEGHPDEVRKDIHSLDLEAVCRYCHRHNRFHIPVRSFPRYIEHVDAELRYWKERYAKTAATVNHYIQWIDNMTGINIQKELLQRMVLELRKKIEEQDFSDND